MKKAALTALMAALLFVNCERDPYDESYGDSLSDCPPGYHNGGDSEDEDGSRHECDPPKK